MKLLDFSARDVTAEAERKWTSSHLWLLSVEDGFIMHYSALASRLCIDTFQEFGRLAIGNGGSLSQKYLLYSFVTHSMLAHWFAGGLFHLL